jgi:HNH endonuclease
MTKYSKPLNEILIEEFLPSVKSTAIFSKQQIVDWLEEHYPEYAESTVSNWLTRMSTNSKARLNWTIRRGKDDIFFKIDKSGSYRLYNQMTDPTPIYSENTNGKEQSKLEITRILVDKYSFTVRKGKRSEGSGIVVSKNGKTYNIKFSYSRSYFDFVKEEVMCTGWHTLFEKEIKTDIFQFFIFVVEGIENDFHYFIFKREDIQNVFDYKVYDSNKKLHFYFRVKKDGRPVELREIEKDMSVFYNNWDKFFTAEVATPVAADINEPTIPERALVATYRILRDTALARRIKADEDHVCQLCGVRITLGNGQPYAEAHHVKPLGKPHEGPDIPDNIVCVCPNCHVKLDYGAVKLSADITSKIRNEFINYHNQYIFSV